jgi:probable HAF family extracellular repeat protein
MQDLGTLGGNYSEAVSINARGQVAGATTVVGGMHHPFRWTPSGGIQDLGTLGGDSGYATSINALGQVAGNSQTVSGDTHAFRWTP